MNGLDFGTAIGLIKGLGSPDPAVIESAVSEWLDDHPEATTTVQDGSITKAKLDNNLQETVDDVADLKSQIAGKQNAPAVAGTSGQVLGLDSSLNPVWVNQQGGGGGGDVTTAQWLYSFPTGIASGAVASFSDGGDNLPVKDLVIAIEPVQPGSGDPSPDNVRPISGRTSATVTTASYNLFDPLTRTTGAFIKAAGSGAPPVGDVITHNGWDCSGYIRVKPNTQYTQTLPVFAGAGLAGIVFYSTPDVSGAISGASTNEQGSNTFTFVTPSNCHFIRFSWSNNFTADSVDYKWPQIEEGPQTAYKPYAGTTIPITFPTEAGAVYGGTLDVTTGVLSVRPYYASYAGETLVGPWVSSMDVYTPGATPTTGAQVVDMGGTVTTHQLSPVDVLTLLGANTIYADTGNTTVTYRADPTLYADKRSTATRSIIAGIESTMTASKAYTTGQLLIVGDTLYKVAASIASGATLTPGTNVNPTTVAEQLILLANA